MPEPRRLHRELVPAMFGAWFCAAREGHCSCCDEYFCEGDEIRSDGQRGWIARCCGDGVTVTGEFSRGYDRTLLALHAAGLTDTGRGTG